MKIEFYFIIKLEVEERFFKFLFDLDHIAQ